MDLKKEYLHVSEITATTLTKPRWLVESLWLCDAVGIIGAAPKSCKSWLSLDIAVSVASATPCLGRFQVNHPGNALVFLAEDNLDDVKLRVESICKSRRLELSDINFYTMTFSSLRLDTEQDQIRLIKIIEDIQPRLIVLDPLVRLHRLDENSAGEMSGLLSFFRDIQRKYQLAIILVHHTGKRSHARAGLSLRGSSDLHAFGDSNLYLSRKDDIIEVITEHRSAPSTPPFTMKLTNEKNQPPYLQIVHSEKDTNQPQSLEQQIIGRLVTSPMPVTREKLREVLRVKNERVGDALTALEANAKIIKTTQGWVMAPDKAPIAALTNNSVPEFPVPT